MAGDDPLTATKKRLGVLMKRQTELEALIFATKQELDQPTAPVDGAAPQPGPGVRGSLLTPDGFPRADIDLYRVRQMRQQFNCAQTDHQQVMREIEENLHKLHALQQAAPSAATAATTTSGGAASAPASASPPNPPPVPTTEDQAAVVGPTQPFALVDSVADGGPASRAGLRVGDKIVTFGDVHSGNHQGLKGVASVVQRNVGQAVLLTVLRRAATEGDDGDSSAASASSAQQTRQQVRLVPQRWDGRGLLGCHIVPHTA